MNTYLRTWALDDIVIRSGGDGRTVEAYAAMFDAPYEVRDQHGHYMEQIDRSAFNRTLRHGIHKVAVLYNHGLTVHGTPDMLGSVPLGTPLEIKPDGRGLLTVTRYNKSELADAVLEAIRNGDIRSQSFRGRIFRSSPDRVPRVMRGGSLPTVVRHELGLSDYGPTPVPVNAGAEILAVRSAALLAELEHLDDDERDALIEELTRHLPGKHRQASHGNRFNTSGDRSSGLRRKGVSKLDDDDNDEAPGVHPALTNGLNATPDEVAEYVASKVGRDGSMGRGQLLLQGVHGTAIDNAVKAGALVEDFDSSRREFRVRVQSKDEAAGKAADAAEWESLQARVKADFGELADVSAAGSQAAKRARREHGLPSAVETKRLTNSRDADERARGHAAERVAHAASQLEKARVAQANNERQVAAADRALAAGGLRPANADRLREARDRIDRLGPGNRDAIAAAERDLAEAVAEWKAGPKAPVPTPDSRPFASPQLTKAERQREQDALFERLRKAAESSPSAQADGARDAPDSEAAQAAPAPTPSLDVPMIKLRLDQIGGRLGTKPRDARLASAIKSLRDEVSAPDFNAEAADPKSLTQKLRDIEQEIGKRRHDSQMISAFHSLRDEIESLEPERLAPAAGADVEMHPDLVRQVEGQRLTISKNLKGMPAAAREDPPPDATAIRWGDVGSDGVVRDDQGRVVGTVSPLVSPEKLDAGGWIRVNARGLGRDVSVWKPPQGKLPRTLTPAEHDAQTLARRGLTPVAVGDLQPGDRFAPSPSAPLRTVSRVDRFDSGALMVHFEPYEGMPRNADRFTLYSRNSSPAFRESRVTGLRRQPVSVRSASVDLFDDDTEDFPAALDGGLFGDDTATPAGAGLGAEDPPTAGHSGRLAIRRARLRMEISEKGLRDGKAHLSGHRR